MNPHTRQFGFGALALVLAVAMLQMGCSKPAEHRPPKLAATGKAASALGDLTRFRLIAVDVANQTNRGDLVAAKLRIKDLEIAWDEAEAGLKPRSAADWHMLDKAIDQALEALRAEPTDVRTCKQKVTNLLSVFDSMR